MPILMPTTFCPMENGDYLLIGQDHGENHKEIARHSPHDADAYDAFNHDVNKVLQAIKPLFDSGAARPLQRRPRGAHRAGQPRPAVPQARQEGPPRRGPAADRQRRRLPRRLLRVRHPQGLPRLVARSSARRSGRTRRAPGSSCSTTSSASTTASSGRGRSTRAATAGSPRCWRGRPSRSGRRSGSTRRSTTSSPRTAGRPAWPSPTAPSSTPRSSSRRSTRAGPSSSSSSRASCRPTSSRPSSASGSRARRPRSTSRSTAPPRYPALGDRTDQYRGFTNIGPSMEYLERAYDDAQVRLVLEAAVPRLRGPVDGRPGHGAARQGRHELLRPVRAVPPARERLGHRARARSATPSRRRSSRSSRASATSSSSARSGRRSTSSGRSACPRATSSPASSSPRRCTSSGRRPAGASTAPRSTATTSAAPGTHPGGCVMGAPGKLAAQRILKDRAALGRGPRSRRA